MNPLYLPQRARFDGLTSVNQRRQEIAIPQKKLDSASLDRFDKPIALRDVGRHRFVLDDVQASICGPRAEVTMALGFRADYGMPCSSANC